MNLSKLEMELSEDPEKIGYASMDDTAALSALNVQNISSLVPIEHSDLVHVFVAGGCLAKIKRAAENWADETGDSATSAAMAGLVGFSTPTSRLDPGNQDDRDLINALVTNDVLTLADKAALIDAATILISRADQLSLGKVRLGDIQRARK